MIPNVQIYIDEGNVDNTLGQTEQIVKMKVLASSKDESSTGGSFILTEEEEEDDGDHETVIDENILNISRSTSFNKSLTMFI